MIAVAAVTSLAVVATGHRGLPRSGSPRPASPSTTTTEWEGPLTALHPSRATPLVVLDIGDSLGIDLGQQLQSELQATGVAEVAMDSVGDTGLVNVAYYNWPAQLAAELASVHPQLLVVFLGANDGQGMDVDGTAQAFGSPGWVAAYTQRVDSLLEEAEGAKVAVAWVGMPAMQDPSLNAEMGLINGIVAAQTSKYPNAIYVPASAVLCPDGQFTATGTNLAGQTVTTRTPDGVHITPDGGQMLAQGVMDAVEHHWHLRLPPPTA